MIESFLRVRAAVPADRRQIAELIHREEQTHRHLDWRNPLDWIDTQPYMLLETDTGVVAALACPRDPPNVAWLRLFTCSRLVPRQQAWDLLWNAALEILTKQAGMAAVILLQDWLRKQIESSGFQCRQEIVLLEYDPINVPEVVLPPGIRIRPMMHYDLPDVAAADASAFDPLWQNSLTSLRFAFSQAAWTSVAESDQGVLGYQLSTRTPFGGHLARLAVNPETQSRGVGRALVADWIQQMTRQGLRHLTVNTQNDNAASLALYHKIGFQETGVRYPVFIRELQGGA